MVWLRERSGFVEESQGVVSRVRWGDAGRELGGVVRGEAEGGMGVVVYGEAVVSEMEMERRRLQAGMHARVMLTLRRSIARLQ